MKLKQIILVAFAAITFFHPAVLASQKLQPPADTADLLLDVLTFAAILKTGYLDRVKNDQGVTNAEIESWKNKNKKYKTRLLSVDTPIAIGSKEAEAIENARTQVEKAIKAFEELKKEADGAKIYKLEKLYEKAENSIHVRSELDKMILYADMPKFWGSQNAIKELETLKNNADTEYAALIADMKQINQLTETPDPKITKKLEEKNVEKEKKKHKENLKKQKEDWKTDAKIEKSVENRIIINNNYKKLKDLAENIEKGNFPKSRMDITTLIEHSEILSNHSGLDGSGTLEQIKEIEIRIDKAENDFFKVILSDFNILLEKAKKLPIEQIEEEETNFKAIYKNMKALNYPMAAAMELIWEKAKKEKNIEKIRLEQEFARKIRLLKTDIISSQEARKVLKPLYKKAQTVSFRLADKFKTKIERFFLFKKGELYEMPPKNFRRKLETLNVNELKIEVEKRESYKKMQQNLLSKLNLQKEKLLKPSVTKK